MAKSSEGKKKEAAYDTATRYTGNLEGPIANQQNVFWDSYLRSLPQQQQDYRNTMGGYQNFAQTGGFSGADIANMRNRATSPLRSIYSRGLAELERNRNLQGGYSPSFGATRSRFMRDMGQQTTDATTAAEANIAQMRQQGRLAGLGGMLNTYGATPGQTSMFGQQALSGTGQQMDLAKLYTMLAEARNSKKGIDWGKWAQIGGQAALTGAMIFSDRNMKKSIKETDTDSAIDRFRKLKLYNWKYKGDDKEYTGPTAQGFKRSFKVGDGKRIALVDVIGETLALGKQLAEEARA